jgi:hypothetical protein
MSARWLLNLLLLIAVVAAAVALYFKPRPAAEPRQRLVPVQAAEITEIEIVRGKQPPIILARGGNEWRMHAPVAARLDETSLARLLELMRLEVSNPLPATDLTRYELDNPWARLRFGPHRVDFGMSNAVTNELYTKSGEHVFAIPARFAAAVPGTAAKLLAHRMFAGGETPSAVRLARFALVHDGVRWQLEPPDPGLSQDDLVRWVDQWRLASSVTAQPASAAAARESIVVELRGGGSITFRVVARIPDLVLRRVDEGVDYHFPARMEALLLAPPNAPAKP